MTARAALNKLSRAVISPCQPRRACGPARGPQRRQRSCSRAQAPISGESYKLSIPAVPRTEYALYVYHAGVRAAASSQQRRVNGHFEV